MRRRVADAVTLRRDIEQQIAEVQSQAAGQIDQLAELRRLLAGVTEAEERLTAASQREQARTDAFRTRKEALKAAYTAARAEYLIEEAAGQLVGDEGAGPAELSALTAGASDRLRDVSAEIERELGRQTPAGDLLDLRPGAPGDSGIRILFAVEPAGTALLIAVLEGQDAVRDDYPEAVWLSADVLQRVRAGQAPEAVAHAFAGTRSFLEEFCPGQTDEVMRSAAALIAANRPRPLAEQRTRLGLTQAQVARRMGVRQERVSAIERAEPGATEIRTLASYVEALGGRLNIVADFGRDRIVLR
jgi:DNA-binding XRE family transcriptional regulator